MYVAHSYIIHIPQYIHVCSHLITLLVEGGYSYNPAPNSLAWGLEAFMGKISGLSLVLCLVAGVSGCEKMAGPNLLHPGSAQEQQRRAIRYDPYPQTDVGPTAPSVRPKTYDKPIAEPSQARWFLNGW
jgi:hypothetical protein